MRIKTDDGHLNLGVRPLTITGGAGAQTSLVQDISKATLTITPKVSTSSIGSTNTPTGTVSTSFVMLGLARSITPSSTGTVVVVMDGSCANNTLGDGGTYQLAWGTGGAPANGAAAAGTVVGPAPRVLFAAANDPDPFSITRVITGLTPGTAYWLDLQFAAITGGTFSLGQVNTTAWEL